MTRTLVTGASGFVGRAVVAAFARSGRAVRAAVRTSGVPFTILRPALFYGPGVKGNFALLLRAARWRTPVRAAVAASSAVARRLMRS